MKKQIIIHPYLFSIFPIIFLYSQNIDQTSKNVAILLVFLTLPAIYIFYRLVTFLVKGHGKSEVIVTFVSLLFFSYGHIHAILYNIAITNLTQKANFNRINWDLSLDFLTHALLLVGFLIIAIKFIGYINQKNSVSLDFTKVLNAIAVILIAIPLFKIGVYLIKIEQHEKNTVTEIAMKNTGVGYNPDIYYIVLDGYARSDTLRKYYGFNNSEFIDFLQNTGFYLAPNSHSNYAWTPLSLSSSLNFEYINHLENRVGRESTDFRIPYEMIRNNKVAQILKAKGYLFVHFNSTWGATQSNKYADIEIEYRRGVFTNEFLRILAQTTVLKLFDSFIIEDLAASHLYAFDKLNDIPKIKAPKFTFMHIIMPHHPYIFDRYGNVKKHATKMNQFLRNMWIEKDQYVDQLIFVNNKVKDAVDKILKESEFPPIIIIQSDHGPQVSELSSEKFMLNRMRIFCAYYLPEGGDRPFYPTITPVNTFRLILNYYFGTNMPLLEDKVYFSTFRRPYTFIRLFP